MSLLSIVYIIILLLNPSSLASLLAISINSRDASIYILVLNSSIDYIMYILAPMLNNILYSISNLFLFKWI